ncbi:hypothetical protein F4604DRAFT_1931979 [Suillus subluteus]|nr:hypothetical protein F4604DRAFT_1931979 [Suillus subluteus]
MSPTPGFHSLDGFSMIGPGMYLRDNHEQGQDSGTTSPKVILIFGWMGARLGYLQSYTHAYTKLYPNASQIVVRCNPDVFWSTISTIQQRLVPVIDALKALHCLPSSGSPSAQRRPRILTHVFSNGGCLQMTCLGRMLQQKYGSVSAQWSFTSALILDSCPTTVNLNTMKHAFSTMVQNPIVRPVVVTFVSMVYFIRFCLSLLFGKQMMLVSDIDIDMQNPRVLPWMGLHTPRLYIFSRNDKSSPWQEVMHHAKIVKEGGMDVRCELFEESEHVAHMRVEPERYWSSVQEVWVVAISKEKGEQRISRTPPAQQRSLL